MMDNNWKVVVYMLHLMCIVTVCAKPITLLVDTDTQQEETQLGKLTRHSSLPEGNPTNGHGHLWTNLKAVGSKFQRYPIRSRRERDIATEPRKTFGKARNERTRTKSYILHNKKNYLIDKTIEFLLQYYSYKANRGKMHDTTNGHDTGTYSSPDSDGSNRVDPRKNGNRANTYETMLDSFSMSRLTDIFSTASKAPRISHSSTNIDINSVCCGQG